MRSAVLADAILYGAAAPEINVMRTRVLWCPMVAACGPLAALPQAPAAPTSLIGNSTPEALSDCLAHPDPLFSWRTRAAAEYRGADWCDLTLRRRCAAAATSRFFRSRYP